MYVIKLTDSYDTFTYTFNDESSGKTSNADNGLTVFKAAMKKYYGGYSDGATLSILCTTTGMWWNEKEKKFAVANDKWWQFRIPLNSAAKAQLEEYVLTQTGSAARN